MPAHLHAARDKMAAVWGEINKTEDDADEESLSETVTKVTMERRLIATARHMTIRLKYAVSMVTILTSSSLAILPPSVVAGLTDARSYTEHLYTDFIQVRGNIRTRC